MTGKEVKSIRTRAGFTQETLAHKLGTSIRAVQTWEQGIITPKGPALLMLRMIDDECKRRSK